MRALLAFVLLTSAGSFASTLHAQQPAAQPAKPPPSTPAASPAAAPPAAPASSPAAAPAPPAAKPAPVFEPTPDQRERARIAYGRGQALYAEGKYADARAAFQEAYLAVPNPIVLLGIAECDSKLGNYEDAYAGFEQYLKERPDAPDRADVEKKRDELAAQPATLALTSTPTGAKVLLDGQDTGKVTPVELPVLRGEHQLEIRLEGYTPVREAITMRIGVRQDLHVELQALPPPPAPPPPPEPEPAQPPPEPPPTTALWITGIVGATGIVTGTVLGFLALSERSDFDANPTEASADRGERLALFADVAFGIGAMSAITAVVLYVTMDDGQAAEAKGPEASKLELLPAVSAGEVGLVGRGRF